MRTMRISMCLAAAGFLLLANGAQGQATPEPDVQRPPPPPAQPPQAPTETEPARRRVAVLDVTSGELWKDKEPPLLGFHITVADLRAVIPMLEADKPDAVVLHIGQSFDADAALEIGELLDKEFQPRFRTVAWLADPSEVTLGVVAGLEEHFAEPSSTLGYFPTLDLKYDPPDWKLAEGRIKKFRDLGARGGLPPQVIEKMVGYDVGLYAIVDERRSAIEWRSLGPPGVEISPAKKMLAVPSEQATQLGILDGIVAGRDSLPKALELGRVDWVGEKATESLQEAAAARRHAKPSPRAR
jgi:hypothetical protein